MTDSRIDAYYAKPSPFKDGLAQLRALALEAGLQEHFKWNAPVYTSDNKNVLGINAFSSHFGIWFFNGCYLKDREKVLENVQEGKTKAMRHWKFTSVEQIKPKMVMAYMKEAVENQNKGLVWTPHQKKRISLPPELEKVLHADPALDKAFRKLSPYKQQEFCEHIETAKRTETKARRLELIIPMIRAGIGLNDRYRK